MTNKPTLVIMAAGMGSRFGGMKQMTPIDGDGHFICEYSVFDAARAGFTDMVCIIKPEMEADFEERVGRRARELVNLRYAFQTAEKSAATAQRQKPLGTAHAVLCAKEQLSGDFVVINADDFYGADAYKAIFDFMTDGVHDDEGAMVAYLLKNTVTENGSVARGICKVGDSGLLETVTERLRIEKTGGGIAFTEDGETWDSLHPDTVVSMNFFGYRHGFLRELESRFAAFMSVDLPKNPQKAEYLLPRVTDALVKEGLLKVRVLTSNDAWYGVTYREDLPAMRVAVEHLRQEGKYPKKLF